MPHNVMQKLQRLQRDMNMNEHNKQIQICLKDGTCTVIDRGLGNCAISGDICDRDRCPKTPSIVASIDLSGAVETVDSLNKKIKNLDAKIETIVESLSAITDLFDAISTEQQRLYYEIEYDAEAIKSNVEYLKNVGDGEAY